MTRRVSRIFSDIAKRALPCPFCGERLTVHDDHHGEWVAHRDETGRCIASVEQLLDEDDLNRWNSRSIIPISGVRTLELLANSEPPRTGKMVYLDSADIMVNRSTIRSIIEIARRTLEKEGS